MTSIFLKSYGIKTNNVENCFFFDVNNRIIDFEYKTEFQLKNCLIDKCGTTEINSILSITSDENIFLEQTYFLETKGKNIDFIGTLSSKKASLISYVDVNSMYNNQPAGHIGIQSIGSTNKAHHLNFTNTLVATQSTLGNCGFQASLNPVISFAQVVNCQGKSAWRSVNEQLSYSVFANNTISSGIFSVGPNSKSRIKLVSIYNCGSKIAYTDDATSFTIFEQCYISGIDITGNDSTKKFEGCTLLKKPPTTIVGKMKLQVLPTREKFAFPKYSFFSLSLSFCKSLL